MHRLARPMNVPNVTHAMLISRSRLMLSLLFGALLVLSACGDEDPETALDVSEPPAMVDTATVDVVTEEPTGPDTSTSPVNTASAAPTDGEQGDTEQTGVELTAGFEGTTGSVERAAPSGGGGTLAAVRAARHANFDRIVFEFGGGGVPGYQIGYVDGPVRVCGSGGLVDLPGESLLAVQLQPTEPRTMEGLLAVRNAGRITNLPVIEEHALVCGEDGSVSWVLGLNTTSRYRAFTLSGPPRLVLDLRHS